MNKKLVMKFIFTLLSAPIIGTLLLIGVYSLPTEPMLDHAKASIKELQHDAMEQWTGETHYASIDYETDFIMVHTAVYPTAPSTILKDAMLNPQYDFTTDNPDIITDPAIYPRFWNGYLVWLKPLLLFLNLSEIKILNLFLQILLFSMTLLSIHSRLGLRTSLAFIFTYFALNPITNILSLQSALMTITLLSILVLIHSEKKLFNNSNHLLFFLIIGMTTTYFEFLTYPLITLGIPLVVALLLNKKSNTKNLLKILILGSICWAVGYGFFWASKWIISYLFTGFNTLEDAFQQVTKRVNETDDVVIGLSFPSTVSVNLYQLLQPPIIISFVITMTAIIKKSIKERRINITMILPCALLALYPLVWFFALRNHSAIHWWWAHKLIVISLFSFLSLFC